MCTRFIFVGDHDTVITGRNMDWREDMQTNLWVLPRGMARVGATGKNAIQWTARYGSLVASAYDLGTADGMNEKGLVASLLYLTESDTGLPDKRPVLSGSLWAQYALDNFATVNEAVSEFANDAFFLVQQEMPNGRISKQHLTLTDATGDSAIFEYVGGQLKIYHDRKYQVVTNSPPYEQQLAINAYWEGVNGAAFMPGSIRAADRFVRAAYFLNAIPRSVCTAYQTAVPGRSFQNQALASTLGILRAVSVPLGITTPGQPNLSSTIWSTLSDQIHLNYYFVSATSPSIFWVDMKKLNFDQTSDVMTLTVAGGQVYGGEVSAQFTRAPAFDFKLAAS